VEKCEKKECDNREGEVLGFFILLGKSGRRPKQAKGAAKGGPRSEGACSGAGYSGGQN
jgi:hypothetical protein